jgi:hypothetical protein
MRNSWFDFRSKIGYLHLLHVTIKKSEIIHGLILGRADPGSREVFGRSLAEIVGWNPAGACM